MAHWTVEVFHKTAANHVVFVSKASGPIGAGGEQQPRIFDATCRQYDSSRKHRKLPTIQRGYVQLTNALRRGIEPNMGQVGMHYGRYICRPEHLSS
jgi:hypothetical protein